MGDIIPNYKSVWLNIDCPIFLVFKAFCAIGCHIKTKVNKQKCIIWIYLSKNSLLSNYIERAGCNIHANTGLGLATDTYNWKENPTFLTKPLTYRICLCHFIEKVTCITKDNRVLKMCNLETRKNPQNFLGVYFQIMKPINDLRLIPLAPIFSQLPPRIFSHCVYIQHFIAKILYYIYFSMCIIWFKNR